jgi:TolB-like protein
VPLFHPRWLALLCALACGCAAGTPTPAAPTEKPPLTMAVISFGGTDAKSSPAEDGCVVALLEAGFRVVDRARIIAAVPNENDVDYSAIGRTLGADLIVEGGWNRNTTDVRGRVEARLISAHSASVLGTTESAGRGMLTRGLGHKLCRELIAQLP